VRRRGLEYEVVDVFTDRPFTGNPLAVVLGADDLDTAAMQAIADEFHLSETGFPVRPEHVDADYRLRIFTPERELPFAGHPSVGAAWVLARSGAVPSGRVVQECGAGLLPLLVADRGGPVTLTGGTPSCGPALDPGPLLRGCGLEPDDLAGTPRVASCGLGFTFLPVRTEALARIAIDVAALRRSCCAEGPFAGIAVFAWDGAGARSRVFAFEAGVAEDPATGSAALGLGAYLVASGLVAPDGDTAYEVVQGVELGRPSRLSCVVSAQGGKPLSVNVSGSVVPIAKGRIRRP
jgi:trans-2,3-dihydro-3-hydroxyanthranilate isomerase